MFEQNYSAYGREHETDKITACASADRPDSHPDGLLDALEWGVLGPGCAGFRSMEARDAARTLNGYGATYRQRFVEVAIAWVRLARGGEGHLYLYVSEMWLLIGSGALGVFRA